jgi:hypothetical protein
MGATEFTCQNGKILKVRELGDLKSLKVSAVAFRKMKSSCCSAGYLIVPFIFQRLTIVREPHGSLMRTVHED